jgi:hypothetical protein
MQMLYRDTAGTPEEHLSQALARLERFVSTGPAHGATRILDNMMASLRELACAVSTQLDNEKPRPMPGADAPGELIGELLLDDLREFTRRLKGR